MYTTLIETFHEINTVTLFQIQMHPILNLVKKEGIKGRYPKAREFDESGNLIRDIEFTDHGRSDHPNPHQHMRENNPTGGTRTREPAEPVTGWDY